MKYVAICKPIATRACWCGLCQTLAAENISINLVFPGAEVTITEELSNFQSGAESGNKMHWKFCPKCGTHLFSEVEEKPTLIIVRAGTLTDSESIKVEGLIWTSEAPSWAQLDPEIPHLKFQTT